MRICDIDFTRLSVLATNLSWGTNNPWQLRYFYEDAEFVYKIWSRRYSTSKLIVRGGAYWLDAGEVGIASIDVGLIVPEVCPALVDTIYDGTGVCRGYVSRKGRRLRNNSEIPEDLIDRVWARAEVCGYVFSDFCHSNVVIVDGVGSLIDIDTPPSELASLDGEFEGRNGVLRPHVHSRYRRMISERISAPR